VDDKLQAVRNVGSSWISLAVTLACGIFLTPFILHRLGDEAYGIWVLVFSTSGLYRIFNLGISSAVIRYVSKFVALRDFENLARFVNTILFLFCCIGAFLLLVTIGCTLYADRIFHITADFQKIFPFLFLLVGSAFSVQFPLGVFGGILEGLQLFWWKNLAQIVSDLLRVLLIVLALTHGLGLFTICLITVALSFGSAGFYYLLTHRFLPVRFHIWKFDRAVFREIISYSAVTFVSLVAGLLRFRCDAIVIGVFISAAAITPFSIGSKIIDYCSPLVTGLAQIFTPMSSHHHSQGDTGRLKQIFLRGNRACAMLTIPTCFALIFLGKSVIEIWVGAKYVSSYWILLALVIPYTIELSQSASPRILYGMSKHWTLGKVRILEGATNLGLSILLLHYYGILGVALGTAIPLFFTSTLFLPQHLCGILDVRLSVFLREVFLKPLLLCLPMAAVLYFLQRIAPAHTFLQLLRVTVAGGLVYAISGGWFFLFKEPVGIQLRVRFLRFLKTALPQGRV
jgi:O-antigen/teichoic acid export membrane protein